MIVRLWITSNVYADLDGISAAVRTILQRFGFPDDTISALFLSSDLPASIQSIDGGYTASRLKTP